MTLRRGTERVLLISARDAENGRYLGKGDVDARVLTLEGNPYPLQYLESVENNKVQRYWKCGIGDAMHFHVQFISDTYVSVVTDITAPMKKRFVRVGLVMKRKVHQGAASKVG
jgi:hypothetical protein